MQISREQISGEWNPDINENLFPLLANAMGSAGSAMFISNVEGVVIWVNEAFTRLSGYSLAELPEMLGRGAASQDRVLPYHGIWRSSQDDGIAWRGEFEHKHKDGSAYFTDEVVRPLFGGNGLVNYYVTIQHDITASRHLRQAALDRGNHDALTGLVNRVRFVELQQQAIEYASKAGETVALLFLDLDGFKVVNDTFGHHIGDAMLKAVADRLLAAVRHSDVVARFGGDEFVVLLPALANRRAALRLGRKILAILAQPFVINASRHRISASLGIAFVPEHGNSGESLLIQADMAMYRAKRGGGNSYDLVRRDGCLPRALRRSQRAPAEAEADLPVSLSHAHAAATSFNHAGV